MKNLKNVLIGIGALFVIFVLIGICLPDEDGTSIEDTDPTVTSAGEFYGSEGEDNNAGEISSDSEEADVREDQVGGKVIHLSAAEFKRLVANYNTDKERYLGSRPCVVDFFADWCGPCKQLSPVMDKMARKYTGKVTIYKVNIDEAPEVSNAYNIESIPTLFFCSNGQIESLVGGLSAGELDAKIAGM